VDKEDDTQEETKQVTVSEKVMKRRLKNIKYR
jgi:hypothetical protein